MLFNRTRNLKLTDTLIHFRHTEAMSVSKIKKKTRKCCFLLKKITKLYTTQTNKQKRKSVTSLICSQCIFFLHITMKKTFRNMK